MYVGMCVCGFIGWSWRKSTRLFLRTKQTHGFICYNNRLATFYSGTLKSLSQSCQTSLPLLNTFPGSFSELGFKPLCATVLGHSWFKSSFSLMLFHIMTSCASDLQHLFQLFLFSFPFSLPLLSFVLFCHGGEEMTCFSLALKAYMAQSCSHAISAVLISLLLPFPIPC